MAGTWNDVKLEEAMPLLCVMLHERSAASRRITSVPRYGKITQPSHDYFPLENPIREQRMMQASTYAQQQTNVDRICFLRVWRVLVGEKNELALTIAEPAGICFRAELAVRPRFLWRRCEAPCSRQY